jgi:uncharacterized membrane protein
MAMGLFNFESTRIGTTLLASFLASLVECVEALTVVLAVGSVRGWSSALAGAASAIALLAAIVAALGPALTRVPLHLVQLLVGAMILLFGLRWLRKAILRAAGLIPLHDEQAAFARQSASMRDSAGSADARSAGSGDARSAGIDKLAFAASFNIVMLEGTEVVFIVIALGAGAALLVVLALGAALHRPLARVPENTLKFIVGVLLSAFGTFWVGEGAGLAWPGPAAANPDLAIPFLMAAYLAIALWLVPLCRGTAEIATVED